jgi:hypothetical protein
VVALEPSELGLELVAVLRGLQAGDPFLGGGEGDAVAALAGFEGERDREVALAGAGRAEEADVGALFDPGELGEVEHERSLGRGLRGPVEVLERLDRREGGVADPHPRTGGVTREHLRFEQRLEETLVRPVLLACHPRRFQLRQQVGQPLTRLRLAHAHSSA